MFSSQVVADVVHVFDGVWAAVVHFGECSVPDAVVVLVHDEQVCADGDAVARRDALGEDVASADVEPGGFVGDDGAGE